MKTPLSWLADYLPLDESPRAIADRLTFSGTEVEGIETVGADAPGVIVAEVRAVERHPNADKLTVCRVFDGAAERQVVCGAPHVAAGGKYPFAPVGVTLPGGLTIKKAKIRGVESFGMLCAEDELGLSKNHEGLMTLDAGLAPGTPLASVLGPPETVFELEVTPNRPDCLSLIGIARELAAVYRRPLKLPSVTLAESGARVADFAGVAVEDTAGCPRYTARVLEGITIGPSPEWMRKRLELAGIRAINNVVDITNYVMLECGHPLHAFDLDLLEGRRVVVRRARAGERMHTLDGVDRDLDPSMLVIADAARPVALAGVMGGAGSEIREATTRVLLESACFRANDIRATARKTGLSTESSYRFERGVDAATVEWASRRAAALMAEYAGGRVAHGVIDLAAPVAAVAPILCRPAQVRRVTGVDVSDAEIRDTLAALQLRVEPAGDGAWQVTPPTFRRDLEAEIDLIEEFARIHGLDRIPETPSRAAADLASDDRAVRAMAKLRGALAGLGASETLHYSLVADMLLDRFNPGDRDQRIQIPRPISADQHVLRPSLVPQMVETLGRNHARQAERAVLFEIGRTYRRSDNRAAEEPLRLVIGMMGPVGRSGLQSRAALDAAEVHQWMRGFLEALFGAMRCAGVAWAPGTIAWAEGRRGSLLQAGKDILGSVGIVARGIRREWRLHAPVAVAELDVAILTRGALAVPSFQPIPAHPSISRDVAMIVDATVTHDQIERVMRAAAPPELESISLFDVFTGASLGAGRRSLAYSLTYRSPSRTLTDDEANGYHDRVKGALRNELRVEIREG